MRICVIANSFPNKSQTFVVQQVLGLLRRGVDVDIYAKNCTLSATEKHELFPDLSSYHVASRTFFYASYTGKRVFEALCYLATVIGFFLRHPFRGFRLFFFLAATRDFAALKILSRADEITAKKYDVFLCQFGPLGNMGILLNRLYGTSAKVATMFRGSDVSSYERAHPHVYKLLVNEGNFFLPVSTFFFQRLVDKGIDPRRIEVHPSGIDCKKFAYHERTSSRINSRTFTFISVGRFTEKKGFRYVLEAIDVVRRQYEHVRLLIVGDGPLKASFLRTIEEQKLETHVSIIPWVPHEKLVDFYRNADACVTHSVVAQSGDMEGIPNVLKEAMATGLIVISTDHAGIHDLIEDNTNGFLVQERDVVALSERMKDVMVEDIRLKHMRIAARERIEARFDIEKLSDRLVALLA